MTLEDALTQRILGVQPIIDLIGDQAIWSRRLTGLPGITMQIVSDPRPQHYKGFQPMRSTAVQIDAWSLSESEARQLRELCIAHLVPGARIGVVTFQRASVDNVRSGSEPEQSGEPQSYRGELFRESIDFTFLHNA